MPNNVFLFFLWRLRCNFFFQHSKKIMEDNLWPISFYICDPFYCVILLCSVAKILRTAQNQIQLRREQWNLCIACAISYQFISQRDQFFSGKCSEWSCSVPGKVLCQDLEFISIELSIDANELQLQHTKKRQASGTIRDEFANQLTKESAFKIRNTLKIQAKSKFSCKYDHVIVQNM